ncbi:hypothetical protein NE237_030759 [Protea cynaroides]|uniref:Uncharacterized protein n=1 Tax=Protea cynaroides TaxID=273540 RepID=A0A9Q0JWC5_9MAGN|nr:hypothetical protein NE237_030759 [Protea cynaroides]
MEYQGLNSPCKQRAVKEWIKKFKLCVCIIIESNFRKEFVDSKLKYIFGGWKTCHNCSQENSARLVVGWDSTMVEVEVLWSSTQLIHYKITFNSNRQEVFCSLHYYFFFFFWGDLDRATLTSPGPWVVLGDCNIMRFGSEKIGGLPPNLDAMGEFNDCLARNGLEDIKDKGRDSLGAMSKLGIEGSYVSWIGA